MGVRARVSERVASFGVGVGAVWVGLGGWIWCGCVSVFSLYQRVHIYTPTPTHRRPLRYSDCTKTQKTP